MTTARRATVAAVLLSVWSGVNLLLAAGILFAMTALGRDPPSMHLYLTDGEVAALAPRAAGLVRSLAVFANACALALCTLALLVIWAALRRGVRWAWWALVAALIPLQSFGFVSDAYLGHANLTANLVSAAVLVAGLVLARWPGGKVSDQDLKGRE